LLAWFKYLLSVLVVQQSLVQVISIEDFAQLRVILNFLIVVDELNLGRVHLHEIDTLVDFRLQLIEFLLLDLPLLEHIFDEVCFMNE